MPYISGLEMKITTVSSTSTAPKECWLEYTFTLECSAADLAAAPTYSVGVALWAQDFSSDDEIPFDDDTHDLLLTVCCDAPSKVVTERFLIDCAKLNEDYLEDEVYLKVKLTDGPVTLVANSPIVKDWF